MLQHPTILIGYGAYGRRVLHSFLAGAAARGALAWNEQGTVDSLNQRRLQSLSLLWIPDTLGLVEQQVPADLLGESGYELMDDLFAQVKELEGSFEEIRANLSEALDVEKKWLLDAGRRGEASVAGLDVIVIAQPTHEEIIGSLRDVLEPAMLRLAADPAFTTVQEGGGDTLLNFIHILDFEEYWAPRMEPVRAALQQVLTEHEDAFASGRPTAGRVYLFDGNTAGGHRSFESRLQEIVLFLELLLLEGLRNAPDARSLYRRERINIPPVCTVGVRVVERSSGLLRRLAAAAFARNWLAHIASTTALEGNAKPFEDLVSGFRGDRLAATIGAPQLLSAASREVSRVEAALLAISPDRADWGEQLRETAERETEASVLRLSEQSGSQNAALSRGVMTEFRQELERVVTAAMQDARPALTLGTVIQQLQLLEDDLGAAVAEGQAPGDLPASDSAFEEAARMQREYAMYRSRQVQTARLAVRWWPRAAVAFAVALSPVVLRGIADSWPSSSEPPWEISPVCAVALGALFWLFGRRAIQPVLSRTAERARQFYTNPERGRLAERVRRIAASEAVAARIGSYTRQLIFGLRQYVQGGVAAELQRARSVLMKRREEVEWLQRQVGEFLLSYQVDASGPVPVFQPGRVTGDVRFSLERSEDLEAVAQSVPPGVDRFRELVASQRLFAGWSKPYCDTFLHPLPFLDRLSEKFHDRLETDEAESRRRAERISSFLEKDLHVPVCFRWLMTDGLPSPQRGSLFPAAWSSLHGVVFALTTSGFGNRAVQTPNTERMYLFESVLGVPTRLLVRPK